MARLSINEMTTYRWSYEDDIARYADAGVSAIGVWRQKLSDFGEEKGIELLAESGLACSCLMWAGGFTGNEGRSFRESVEDAFEAVQLAADLNARCLVVYSGDRGGHTFNHARRLVREAMAEAVTLADQLDVDLAIEPMHPGCADGWTFLTDIQETLNLLDEIGHPRAKIVFDAYHFGYDRRAVELIASAIDRVGLVQLGDSAAPPRGREQDRRPLGQGSLPLANIVAALAQAGYDGDFDVELLGQQFECCCYDALLRQTREAYDQLLGCGSVSG